ncbi:MULTISPECIES: hypothetical protein [Bacillaceae]|nr:hypothetical protein [Bacillus sp. PK3_68]
MPFENQTNGTAFLLTFISLSVSSGWMMESLKGDLSAIARKKYICKPY